MNNKGQTLVVFVILLPFILLTIFYVISISYLNYNKKSLENIADIICTYALDNDNENDIHRLALENDNDIKKVEINKNNNEIEITLVKEVKEVFTILTTNSTNQIKVKTSCIKEN